MGPVLSEPVTEKTSASDQDSFVIVGSSSMQGWRSSMEDAHVHLLNFDKYPGCRFFAVYDGHGSKAVAQYAKEHLHERVLKSSEFREGKMEAALKAGFLSLDAEMMKDDKFRFNPAGSTSVVILMKDNMMYCANAGDSRAIVSVRGGEHPLSYDHKPQNEGELKRIETAGGFVNFNRVNGSIALSRALGDFDYKRNQNFSAEEQIITANPDVISMEITSDHEFFVIACDGIWDCMNNQEVVDFVRERLAKKMEPVAVCEELMTNCLSAKCRVDGKGCDNMTVIIGAFLHGGSMDSVAEQCQRPSTPSAVRRPRVSSDADENPEGAESMDAEVSEFADETEPRTDAATVKSLSGVESSPAPAGSGNPPTNAQAPEEAV